MPTAYLAPSLGAQGAYTVQAPYDTLVNPNLIYTCKGIRTIDDILAAGFDPYATYYSPGGTAVDKTKYQDDVNNGVVIVSLLSSSGQMVYVPNSYITAFPAPGGVAYSVMALAVKLGALPTSLDLTSVKQKVSDLILNTLGVNGDVTEMQISAIETISSDAAKTAEAARLALVTDNGSDWAKYLAAKTALDSANQKIAALEQWIKAHPPAP